MTRHRHAPSSVTRVTGRIVLVLLAVMIASPATAQNPDWRIVENPYQEDMEYAIGDVYEPQIEVDGVRWRSFRIETPERYRGLLEDGENIEAEVTVEFENRRSKSAKILVIFLLENENGDPLERIAVREFKIAGNRVKERKDNSQLSAAVVNAARRVYVFFEILN